MVRLVSYSLSLKCQGSTAVVFLVIFPLYTYTFTFDVICWLSYVDTWSVMLTSLPDYWSKLQRSLPLAIRQPLSILPDYGVYHNTQTQLSILVLKKKVNKLVNYSLLPKKHAHRKMPLRYLFSVCFLEEPKFFLLALK